MQLPILETSSTAGPQALVRYYHQAEARWTEHLSESVSLDIGMAWANAQLARVHMANRILDAALPAGLSPADAFAQVERHYSGIGSTCYQWVMNPSAPAEQVRPMEEYLVARGFSRQSSHILRLEHAAAGAFLCVDDVRIIPARSSFRHARELSELKSRSWDEPQLAEAGMLHLDDPHYDALMALREGRAVAYAGLLAIGEVGMIEQVYVVEDLRRRGLGTMIMERVMEIAARGQIKHVLLSVGAGNGVAIAMYEKLGFRMVGEFVWYQRHAGPPCNQGNCMYEPRP